MDLFKPLEYKTPKYETPSSKLRTHSKIQSKQNECMLSMMNNLREELEEERKINDHLHNEYMRLISKYDQLLSLKKQSFNKTHDLFDEYKKLCDENKRLILDNADLYIQLQEANDQISVLKLKLPDENDKFTYSTGEDISAKPLE